MTKAHRISGTSQNYFRAKILDWGRANFARFPWRRRRRRWHLLVAEMMLQRTNAEQVVPVYKQFVKKYAVPEAYLQDKTAHVFRTLGLIWREDQLRKLCQCLQRHDVPDGRKDLLLLPGVGDYIASAYRSMHRGIWDRIVDSNVVRLYGRFFGFDTDGETRRKKWLIGLAAEITPKRSFRDFNYALIDFTRNICTPVPTCRICPIRRKCLFFKSRFG